LVTIVPNRASGNAEISRAVALLRAGRLVAFPTETVYGLGADATSADAVARLFAVKGRPADHPVIAHLAGADRLDDFALDASEAARALADAFWPGPLTLVVRRVPGAVVDAVTGGLETVGLRVPDAPLALALLDALGAPIAAPSANRFGRVSPTAAADVEADLGSDVDLILDGGPAAVGVESTIVDCTTDAPALLRPGGLARESIEAVLGRSLRTDATTRAPGTLAAHYAPHARVVLVEFDGDPIARAAELAHEAGDASTVIVLDRNDDVDAYARELYARLRDADRAGAQFIVARLPPPAGVGLAVRDRLRRAAASR
jgi:L-threonylcarbamoyladenylate synthase